MGIPEKETLEVRPCAKVGFVFSQHGKALEIPTGWGLLPPGDAALSRRIKKDGPSWTVKEKKGRKMFSRGIWAPANRIEAIKADLEQERSDPSYQKRLDAGRARRAKEQEVYAEDFEQAVFTYLDFHPSHHPLAEKLANAIATHAVPVGSGTVARTKRIPVEQRAEAATIAWMRHQTTAYDDMTIRRVKGERREVRRMLAKRSKQLLATYRSSGSGRTACPLAAALG